jgi:hypothetical protein
VAAKDREIADCIACTDSDDGICQEHCDHPDGFDSSEGNMCLSCGKDGTEDVMSAAFDRAKSLRQYGH